MLATGRGSPERSVRTVGPQCEASVTENSIARFSRNATMAIRINASVMMEQCMLSILSLHPEVL